MNAEARRRRRHRLPDELPKRDDVPEAPTGCVHVVHHADAHAVACLDVRTGRARPAFELTAGEEFTRPGIAGRYLPARSGALACYRDEDGQTVVQHRRRRLAIPAGARCRLVTVIPLRILVFRVGATKLGWVWVVDTPGRWRGSPLMRAFDFTWAPEEDWDLALAIRHHVNGEYRLL